MTQATRVLSTPPTNTPIDTHRRPSSRLRPAPASQVSAPSLFPGRAFHHEAAGNGARA